MADRQVHRLDDVMRARMQRGQHVRQAVEVGQVGERRQTPPVVEIAHIGRAGHRHEDRVVGAERKVLRPVPRAVDKGRRDRRDQLAHEAAVEVNHLVHDLRADPSPVLQRDGVAEQDAHRLEDVHRGCVDPFDLFGVHRFDHRQAPLQRRQHPRVPHLAKRLPRPAPRPPPGRCFRVRHPTFSPSLGSVRSIQMVLSSVYWSWAWRPLSRPPKLDWRQPPNGVAMSPSP